MANVVVIVLLSMAVVIVLGMIASVIFLEELPVSFRRPVRILGNVALVAVLVAGAIVLGEGIIGSVLR